MPIHDPADNALLPYDDAFDPKAPQKPRPAVLSSDFAYLGSGLGLEAFQGYVATYDFGKIKPDFVVFHHTANPDASWAPIGSNPETKWDRHENGLDEHQVYTKRQRQLTGIKNYYASLGWNAGPHLFIDDRFIWLFTPMNTVGIHAKWGNSFRAMGALHYSVGIECIGYYERTAWPASVAHLVGGAVRALQTRLNISSEYLYATAPKPGMVGTGDAQKCAHPERLRYGGLSSHRDYNKPECPGSAITEAFYTSVVKGAASPPPVSLPSTRYRVRGVPIHEAPNVTSPVALGGMAILAPGTEIQPDQVKDGWAHVPEGFIDAKALEVV